MSKKLSTKDIFNLPDEDSHSEGSAYDSEEERDNGAPASKSAVSRASKNKTSKKANTAAFGLDQAMGGDNDSDYSSEEEEEEAEVAHGDDQELSDENEEHSKMEGEGSEAMSTRVRKPKKSKKVQPLTPEELKKFQDARNKAGILYISRIPPFMKPIKLRHLLGKFGELGRVYLAPEDAKVAARRKKYGGNKKQNYTEGWVEFLDKNIAKQVANSLNTTTIGGSKKSFYHDDMWNIKYLPKFKWDHLTERIAYENASRAQRLQAEISQAKRENKFIMNSIEKSKMIKNMEEKKEAKRKVEDNEASAGAKSVVSENKIRRSFKQRRLGESDSVSTGSKPVQGKIKSVLGSVFGR
ncbi:RNA-binding ATPase activator esf2 [Entomortierella beljakovae]|nr:RNA-binding ATPase activator esf2 [Entomortierella beljakovae]